MLKHQDCEDGESRLHRYTNPKIVGPGVWYCLHMLAEQAVKSNTEADFSLAYLFAKNIRDNFPCMRCRDHMKEFWSKNNPERFKPFIDDGKRKPHDSEGLSFWLFQLHTAANRHATEDQKIQHLGESYREMTEFFRNSEACMETNCAKDDMQHSNLAKYLPGSSLDP